jgi:hypothetical protein
MADVPVPDPPPSDPLPSDPATDALFSDSLRRIERLIPLASAAIALVLLWKGSRGLAMGFQAKRGTPFHHPFCFDRAWSLCYIYQLPCSFSWVSRRVVRTRSGNFHGSCVRGSGWGSAVHWLLIHTFRLNQKFAILHTQCLNNFGLRNS